MTLRTMDEWAVRKRLKVACDDAGGQQAFADKHGLNQPYVAEVRSGLRAPNGVILKALGLRAVTRYARERKKGRAA
jgi:hypothetical protein